MVRRVVVAVDGSEQAEKAVEYALEQFPDDELAAIYVVNPTKAISGGEYPTQAVLDAEEERARSILRDVESVARDHDREIATESLFGRPSREIVSYADGTDADQIVVGSHGRTGVSRVLLGSVAESIVRRAPVPVTVVR